MKHIAHRFCAMTILVIAYISVAAKNNCTIDDTYTFTMCSSNQTYTVNCSNLSLAKVPKLYPNNTKYTLKKKSCALDLSKNNFSKLINRTFLDVHNLNTSELKVLILSRSNISYISTEAFLGLEKLQLLNLSENHLSYPWGFGEGVFKPMISLKYLNIKENNFSTFHGLGNQLRYMKNLEGIYAELCANCTFGEDFKELKNLRKVSLSGRSEGTCYAPYLYNNTFLGLTFLKGLWLSLCNISNIESNAFSPMKNSLTHLDISYNENIGFTRMDTALYGLRFSTKLTTLKVNRIHNVHEIGVKLRASHLNNLSTMKNLTKLYMDLNKIEILDEDIFHPVSLFPATLRVLTFDENRLSYGRYVDFIHNATNITCLDISRQHLYYDPFMTDHYEFDYDQKKSKDADRVCFEKIKNFQNYTPRSNCSITIPPNLRRLKWSKSFLNFDFEENVTICGGRSLVNLDLSFNLFTRWKTSIKGFEHLKHLDLSENDCWDVIPSFFDNFPQLQSLNLAVNYLGITFGRNLSDRSYQMFRNLKQLTHLDLSDNRIERFTDPVIFKPLTKMKQLLLHTNLLSDWNYDLPISKSLSHIDLSQNKLTRLPVKMTSQLDQLCLESSCNVTIKLLNNSIVCDCDNLIFFKWILSTKVNVSMDACQLNAHERDISDKSALLKVVNTLEGSICNDKSWIVGAVGSVCVVLGVLFSLVIAFVIYKNRWKLRYFYYRRNRRFHHEGFERLFENDAFVSYAKSNASFMKYFMVPAIENERGLRLWVADRNSMPGTSIAENITYGINTSRKSVLLIDQAYLKDSWCDYEMNMAHVESTETKRKLIIIVLMENLPIEKLPINIMRFLRSEISIEYPKHGQDLNTFWTNLADQIMS